MFFLAAMFLASTCTCAVYGKRRPLQSAHAQVLAKNMAAKKNTLRFCSRSYVSVCKYSVPQMRSVMNMLVILKPSGTHAKVSQLVASLPTSCQQVVITLFVPSCQLVCNKLLTICNIFVIIRLVTRLF